ncbi:phytoene desaturase family protein [Maribellus mangrovi]|uniref:phytoene desaturase family protein n=1 Tax=Maribellus mangrovi TaxID=3133146 RepID=UPI0030EC3B06
MNKYDIIIIGSGLGGLQTGYILSKEGYRVCILEQGSQIGGSIQNFVRDGVIFDTGAHYIGCYDKGQTLYRYFDYFNLNDKLVVHRMDQDRFDEISFRDNGKAYPHALGFENFAEKLIQSFPAESKAINTYVADIKNIGNDFPLFSLNGSTTYSSIDQNFHTPISDYLSSLTNNQRLKAVLAGSNFLYAGQSGKTPYYVHALISNSYIQSSYRLVGGSGQIARLLFKGILELGGTVLKNKKVVEMKMIGKNIERLITSSGEEFFAKNVISNAHPVPTFKMLPEEITKKIYFKRLSNLENTMSVFSLYIIFKKDSFRHFNFNIHHHENHNVWLNVNYNEKKWPYNYMFFTLPGRSNSKYAEGAIIISPMRYSEFARWEGTQTKNRPAEYYSLKDEKKEMLLSFVEERFPEIRNSIESVYSSTPLTYRDYTATHEGSMYGIARDATNLGSILVMPKTKIPNLFITGQNVIMHGVLGITVGSIQTAANFVGREKLLEQIR